MYVTKEMIAAGFEAFKESGIVGEALESDALLCENIYRAMEAARESQPGAMTTFPPGFMAMARMGGPTMISHDYGATWAQA